MLKRVSFLPAAGAGFTLIEFIMVMVIVGVFSAVAIASISAKGKHSVRAHADKLRRDLSHLQALGISRSVRLRLSTAANGASYTVVVCGNTACSSTSSLTDPATGSTFSATFSDGITISPANSNLDFDSLGRPTSSATLATSSTTFTLMGSGKTATVTVLPITGFATADY